MSDSVMIDLERYLSSQEQAEDEEERLAIEKSRELRAEVAAILHSHTEISDKISKLMSLIEFEIQEAKDEGY